MKVIRAEEHLASVTAEVDFYRESEPYGLIGQFNEGQTEYFMRLECRYLPSSRLPALVGDCLFNLRSALDHLAYELVGLAMPNQMDDEEFVKRIQYPIYDSASTGRRKKPVDVGRTVPGISDDALDAIKLTQPYTAGDEALRHPLSILQRLNNHDKHRKLLLVSTGILGGFVGINFSGGNIRRSVVMGNFKSEAEVVRWELTPAELRSLGCMSIDEVEVEGFAQLLVTFDEADTPSHISVVDVLEECVDAVNEVIRVVSIRAGLLSLPLTAHAPSEDEPPPS